MRIKLGDKVKDKHSKFKGTVIGVSEFLYGCTRIGVKSSDLHEGSPIESVWFDEPQLDLIKKKVAKRASNNTGGPFDIPVMRKDPN